MWHKLYIRISRVCYPAQTVWVSLSLHWRHVEKKPAWEFSRFEDTLCSFGKNGQLLCSILEGFSCRNYSRIYFFFLLVMHAGQFVHVDSSLPIGKKVGGKKKRAQWEERHESVKLRLFEGRRVNLTLKKWAKSPVWSCRRSQDRLCTYAMGYAILCMLQYGKLGKRGNCRLLLQIAQHDQMAFRKLGRDV